MPDRPAPYHTLHALCEARGWTWRETERCAGPRWLVEVYDTRGRVVCRGEAATVEAAWQCALTAALSSLRSG